MDQSKLSLKSGIFLLCLLVSTVYIMRTPSAGSFRRSLQEVSDDSAQVNVDTCSGVDISDSFTSDQIQRSQGITDYLQKIRGGNKLLGLANPGTDVETFGKDYLIHLIPFIAIGVVMFVLSILCLFCHCCNYRCFRGCTEPTKGNKICYMLLSVIFCLLMIGTSAAGWYFSQGLDAGYQKASCAGTNMIADFATGTPEESWIGLTLAASNLTYIRSSITATLNGLPNFTQTLQNLTTQYDALVNDITAYYDDFKDSTVMDPNVTATQPVTPYFISHLGPTTDSDTFAGGLFTEANIKYTTVNNSINSANSSINTLRSQATSISNTLDQGIDQVTSLNDTVTDILNGYTTGTNTGKNINSGLSTGILVFFIVSAVISAIMLLAVINTFTLKSRIGVKVLVFARYFMNVILIFLAFVSAITVPTLIVAMEGCNAAQQAFKNETLFDGFASVAISDYSTSNFSEYAHTCFFSDGYILGDLKVEDQLNDLQNIYDQVLNLSNFTNTSIPDSYVIPINEFYINYFMTGFSPVDETIGGDLVYLNALTNGTYASTCGSRDTWFLNSVNCTSDFGPTFTTADQPSYNFGSPTCMSFDQFDAVATSPNQRYNATSPCLNFASVDQWVGNFKTHLSQVRTLFTDLSTSLDTINGSNINFMTQIRNVSAPVANVKSQVLNILNLVGNNQTGLLSNFNCSFMSTNSQYTVDNLCIAYLPILFLTSIAILSFALATLLGLFPIFFAGKIQIEERRKIYEEEADMNQQFIMRQN